MKPRFLAMLSVAVAGVVGFAVFHEPTAIAAVINPGGNPIVSSAIVGGHLIFTRTDKTTMDAGVFPTQPYFIPTGTPTAATPGSDGQMFQDAVYIYTFQSGSWKKSARANLD